LSTPRRRIVTTRPQFPTRRTTRRPTNSTTRRPDEKDTTTPRAAATSRTTTAHNTHRPRRHPTRPHMQGPPGPPHQNEPYPEQRDDTHTASRQDDQGPPGPQGGRSRRASYMPPSSPTDRHGYRQPWPARYARRVGGGCPGAAIAGPGRSSHGSLAGRFDEGVA